MRISRRSCSSTRRRAISSTPIRCSASRRRAIPIPFAPGGSRSARPSATARAMLVQAAAQQWKVDPASCTASNGTVTHAATGRTLGYGALADAAARITPPTNVALKDPKNFVLIGKRQKRLDTPNKTDGKVVYGIDAMLPGMKFATIAASPVLGGKVAHVDDSAAKTVPGVEKVDRARRHGGGGRPALLGREERPRRARRHLERRPQRTRSVRKRFGSNCAPRARRPAPSRNLAATSRKAWAKAKNTKPPTKCRSSRTRRWSR